MVNLKEAREKGRMKEFIKEHEGDAEGDADQVNRTLKAMAQKSKAAPKASSRRNPGD